MVEIALRMLLSKGLILCLRRKRLLILSFTNSFGPLIKCYHNSIPFLLVEGDGRLVPATDDEVMEVEDLLEDEKSELPLLEEPGDTEQCTSSEGFLSKKANLEGLEDMHRLSESDNTEVEARKLNARLEYIEEMLQKVKQEERLRLSCESPDNSSKYTNIDGPSDQHDRSSASSDKLHADYFLQETVSLVLPRLNDDDTTQSASVETYQKPKDEPIMGGSSVSDICTSSNSKPELSIVKGEICLDNLSIRELQETFKATFGRETSVKDKLWLKRRIAMGMTGSCDVSTSVIIKEKSLARKKAKKAAQFRMESNKYDGGSQPADQIIGPADDSCRGLPNNSTNLTEDGQRVLSSKRLRKAKTEWDMKSEDLHVEHTAAKRVRKPTRRYIEELSEVETRECSGRLVSSVKNSGHGQSSPQSRIRPVCNLGSLGAAFVTRQDSFGGSGVQVPYVSRVRRGRPRKNFMALTKFHPNGMAAKLVRKALGVRVSRQDGESGSRIWKARSLPKRIAQPTVAETETEEQPMVTSSGEQQQDLGSDKLDSSGDTSDDNVAIVPTSKGGTRRKHHRAWTLCEVMKLVEGVSRYGAGRWSEIKKVAFASSSYRTSVDLKDKWRNLLRASFSQAPTEKGVGSSRKHPSSMPIPTPILVRVRELAEMHSQVGPDQSFSKFAGRSRSLHDTRSHCG
ncbi:uncharacterized protein LOC131251686 isoform X2 [Magnolia sinica]|uniref:uncharacterized protein LOC131251686 isoform X2 n=1 Tax=Magnolia sinica TaxID=86752 RepID=UPI0026599570|nr:uncharacterized protein LOC131251686 isoform X2 [Magnolia sinica]